MQEGSPELFGRFELAVVVAVFAVRVMQVTTHQIIDVFSMGDAFMTAVLSMHVARLVPIAVVLWCALVLICSACRQGMFVGVVSMDVMHVPVVEIVRMALVLDGRVSTVRAVDV